MTRKYPWAKPLMWSVCALALAILPGCGIGKALGVGKGTPDEFAVSKQAPLVIPPDFNLKPPRPGAPRPQDVDSQGQALEALFGTQPPPPPKSPGEQALLDAARASRVSGDIRATVRDDGTALVDKGPFLKELLTAEPGDRDPETVKIATPNA